MGKPALHFEILDGARRAMLPKLAFLRSDYGFYLAGGTGLALQIKHRKSVDFDFYCLREFDPNRLSKRLAGVFGAITPVHVAEGTLLLAIHGIEMSFFRYDYPLLKPLVRTAYLDVGSLEDIAAMKLIAIVQRGTKRDFLDLDFLLRRYGLATLLRLTEKKYPGFNRYIGLRALTYFEDAEHDTSRLRLRTFERITWGRVKRDIIEAVDRYRKEHLPRR